MPEALSPIFQQRLVARDDEIDELGHVSNVAIVRWIQDVAVAHSAAVGWDYDAYRKHGFVFVVRRHEVDYLRPVLAGQEVVLETWIESWQAASSIRCTRILRVRSDLDPSGASGGLQSAGGGGSRARSAWGEAQPPSEAESSIANARTQWVFVSTETGRPRRIPGHIASSFLDPRQAAARDG